MLFVQWRIDPAVIDWHWKGIKALNIGLLIEAGRGLRGVFSLFKAGTVSRSDFVPDPDKLRNIAWRLLAKTVSADLMNQGAWDNPVKCGSITSCNRRPGARCIKLSSSLNPIAFIYIFFILPHYSYSHCKVLLCTLFIGTRDMLTRLQTGIWNFDWCILQFINSL